MRDYFFIHENSHTHKIRTLVISFSVIVFLVAFGLLYSAIEYYVVQNIPVLRDALVTVETNVIQLTPIGLFYENLLGGIFFVPTPDEAIYYYALLKGNNPWIILIASVAGYMISQTFNYILGLKISRFVLNLVSKKKVYKTRRFVNKYGVYGIFLFNLLPFLPSPLLSFGLGISRYNFRKLFVITLIGNTLKYSLIILIYFALSR